MPIYEYQCNACREPFERLVRSSFAAAPSCPACASADVKRRLSTFASFASRPTRPCDGGSVPVGGCGSACACPHH